ncbi:endoglucanase [Roseburia sp. CAG:380]|nr:endoglucanase [Roseburia sp. CAG:380]
MRKFTKQILASVLSLAMVVSSASGIGIASAKKTANAEEASATATAAPNNIGEERTLPSGFVTRDNGIMRDNMDSAAYMSRMGLGWNYGNSLDQAIDTSKMSDEEKAKVNVKYCETSANNLVLTQKNVDTLKQYGFRNVRIPVAWSNLMDISEDKMTYTINEGYLQRVEQVINYCLNDGMYAIVNIHYDGDWWGQFGDADESVRKQAWARFRQIWTQVSNRYRDYSDRLIFESANEELGDRLNDNWVKRDTNNKTGVLTVDEQYETMNKINQEFVNIVRQSGGNNEKRYLLIAGYSTNIERTCDERFVMPTDPIKENGVSKLSVSVHYYTPWNYCGGSEYHQVEGGAARLYDWGTDEDIKAMHAELDKMSKFTEQGYGVIIGEYGVQTTAADGIANYIYEMGQYALEKGMIPVLWDNGGWFNRQKNIISYDDVAQAILDMTGAQGIGRKAKVNTGKPLYTEVQDESGLTPVYSWEGKWKKNGGDNETYCEPALTVLSNDGTNDWYYHCNSYGYWAVIYSEALKNVKHLYVRVTCENNDIDSSALQFASAEFKENYPPENGLYDPNEQLKAANSGALENCTNGKETNISAEESWSGKLFSIDEDLLQGKSILWISASNKPVFTKIELFASDAPFPEVSPLPVPPRRTPVPYPSDDVVMPTQSPNPSAPAPTATVPAATTAPVQTAQVPTPSSITVAKGDIVKDKNASYKISNVKSNTVEYKAPLNSKKATVTVPATVKVSGVTYKVTSIAKNAFKNNKKLKKVTIGANITTIGANAFAGCKNLKTVDIKSKKLKSVGKNAFKGIHKKAVFKVPAKKLKAYKKLLNSKAGIKKTMKIKK